MKRLLRSLLLLSVLAAQSCTSTQKLMNSWMGSTGAEFIAGAGMGPPEDVRPDGRGGHILIWGSYPNAVTQIYVDSDDRIYYWRTYNSVTWVDYSE